MAGEELPISMFISDGPISTASTTAPAAASSVGSLFSALAPAIGPVAAFVAAATLVKPLAKVMGASGGATYTSDKYNDLRNKNNAQAGVEITKKLGALRARLEAMESNERNYKVRADPKLKAQLQSEIASLTSQLQPLQGYMQQFGGQGSTPTPAPPPSPVSNDISQMTQQQIQSIAQPVPLGFSGPGANATLSGQGASHIPVSGQTTFPAPTTSTTPPVPPTQPPGKQSQQNWLTQMLQGAGQNFAQGVGKIPGVGPALQGGAEAIGGGLNNIGGFLSSLFGGNMPQIGNQQPGGQPPGGWSPMTGFSS